MLFIELSIFMLLIISCIFYIWDNTSDPKQILAQERSAAETYFAYVQITSILLSMLIEMTKVVVELCKLAREKCRKKTAEEKLK